MIYTKMDINEIRRANLRRIASEYESRAAFARAIGRSEQQLYYLIGKKAAKAIGDRIARDVEKRLKLGHGALDVLQEPAEGAPSLAPDGVNLELLGDCIAAVEHMIESQGFSNIPPEKKAQAVALAYSATLASGKNQVVSVDFIVRTIAKG